MKKWSSPIRIGIIALVVAYLITRLTALTILPVFADEAIYIRWAQLIIDDWRQYLFFPLNDGKTPLFIWLTVPLLSVFQNPLFAGRLVAVAAGLLQVFVIREIVKTLGGKRPAVHAATWIVLAIPFWYFHHRIALMDGLLTALISLAAWLLLRATQLPSKTRPAVIGSGLALGAALWTKLPAVLSIPMLGLFSLLNRGKKVPMSQSFSSAALVVLIGMAVFGALKLHPAFGQLFNRGSDFLYSVPELLERGVWSVSWRNGVMVVSTLAAYLTWPVILLPLVGLFQDGWRRKHALLLLSTLVFLIPIIVLGKTIYPRYLLPAALPLTISASLVFGTWFQQSRQRSIKKLGSLVRVGVLITLIITTLSPSFHFMLISWKNPDFLPYTPLDRVQYATEWSSGHGVRETTDLLLQETPTHSTAVATEGYFGTLPDGILMYLHNQDVSQLMVEGIGQPVRDIPDEFRSKAQAYDQVWLVVNSHREKLGLNQRHPELLKQEFCRIQQAPCLQVWDITSLVKTTAEEI